MKRLLIFILLFVFTYCNSQEISVCTWNLRDFGNSKSQEEMIFIANTVKSFDIVAIQEVVAHEGGKEAVIRLCNLLVKSGDSWEYAISEPTSSSGNSSEHYAFLWKNKKVKRQGDPWLEVKYNMEIEREPYFITFKVGEKIFTLVTFHAIPKSKQPETEVKYLKFFPAEYPGLKLIFCGDFNLPQSHSVFNPLKSMGYMPVLQGQKTSLRDRCLADGCLANELDNIFLKDSEFELIDKGVIHFYKSFSSLDEARKISDHIPVYVKFKIK
jgi:endonuclease/exonuclease/phosphatase family metal-dependent hydrolase